MNDYGKPGPGGNIGKCAVCGNTFLLEVLLGTKVYPFGVDGIERTLWAHEKCRDLILKLEGKWQSLPTGPLREAFAKAIDKKGE